MNTPQDDPFAQNFNSEPPRKSYSGLLKICWILIIVTCVLAFVPFMGFFTWILVVPIFLICLISAIIIILRGGKLAGIFLFLISLFVLPIVVLYAPFLGTIGGVVFQMFRDQQKRELVEKTTDPASPEIQDSSEATPAAPEVEVVPRVTSPVFISMKDKTWESLTEKTQKHYKELSEDRAKLNAADTAAVTAFNKRAETYKELTTQMDQHRKKLSEAPTPPEQYEVLTGEARIGSGFVVRLGTRFLGVASLRQFKGSAPERFQGSKDKAVALDKSEVVKQNETQILPVISYGPLMQFLNYQPDYSLNLGDEIIILAPSNKLVTGVLGGEGLNAGSYKSANGPMELEARLNAPMYMRGGSGAPVILKQTGAVIGVLLTTDEGESQVAGFETLCIRESK